MSQADVEIVLECTRRFAAGRHVADEYFAPEIVWDTSESGMPAAGVYHGREGVRQFFRDWLADWRDYEIEALDCIDAGGAVVLVFRQAATGRRGGVRTERDFFGVYELEEAKVVRFRLFASREQAFEAAELSE
jgi:ketosteroid isomerase-like protein